MKSIALVIALSMFVAAGLNAAIFDLAFAQGAAEVALDAGPDATAAAPAVSAPSDFNPLGWDWSGIALLVLTILGALVTVLRVLAPMTKTKTDDKALGWLEWLTDLLAKILVPKQYRGFSLGGGKVADNVKFPPKGQV